MGARSTQKCWEIWQGWALGKYPLSQRGTAARCSPTNGWGAGFGEAKD